jgi:hypothetical protein
VFVGMSYTWSKDLTTASGDTNFVRPDQFTKMAYYGPSGNDRRHNLAINYVIDLPRLAHENIVTRAILGGWQVSGVSVFQSGSPFGIGYSITGVAQQNITGSTTEGARVSLSGNPSTGDASMYNRLNAAMVGAPNLGSIGLESGVNYMRGPGINNFNLSVQKQFSIKERVKLQFRADAFNVFNHTQFSGYNSTVNFGVYNPANGSFGSATTTQNGVFGGIVNGQFTAVSPSNLYLKPDGSVNNINGFGTVNGARDPRIMQLVIRLQF